MPMQGQNRWQGCNISPETFLQFICNENVFAILMECYIAKLNPLVAPSLLHTRSKSCLDSEFSLVGAKESDEETFVLRVRASRDTGRVTRVEKTGKYSREIIPSIIQIRFFHHFSYLKIEKKAKRRSVRRR